MTILVTGGAGFIGSNFIYYLIKNSKKKILNLDLLTYAGNINNLVDVPKERYRLIIGSINDFKLVSSILNDNKISSVVNFAAESHVDRSIHGPSEFINTNILGTFNLLEASRSYFKSLNGDQSINFKFLHVSTDEVYGSLKSEEAPFTETNQYKPNSPYAASKASSDHLVRAYNKTYNLPTLITNCSNNYGPFQFPEKLIPLIISNAINEKNIPVYGDGLQVRDWLYVEDHCSAIEAVLKKGKTGETYNIGGLTEKTNIDVVNIVCDILQDLKPRKKGSYRDLITYVKDRPGHDTRYAINANKISRELNWKPKKKFEEGIFETVNWYLKNQEWIENIISGEYKNWIKKNYNS